MENLARGFDQLAQHLEQLEETVVPAMRSASFTIRRKITSLHVQTKFTAEYWRDRAEEARAIAYGMREPGSNNAYGRDREELRQLGGAHCSRKLR